MRRRQPPAPKAAPEYKFGCVCAMRETFGFLRPLHRPEDVYFNLREAPRDVEIGDVLYYTETEGTKGPMAVRAEFLPVQDQITAGTNLQGVIKTEVTGTGRKLTPGLISITEENSPLKGFDIPFTHDDLSNGKRVGQGDGVKCDVVEIPNLGYVRASNVSVNGTAVQRRREAEKQQLLDANMPREQGIVDTLKGDYGFLRCVDRAEDVYFRVEDIQQPEECETSDKQDSDESRWQVEPGMEVEFFVMSEAGREGLRARAMYIDMLPKGTVQFEIEVRASVRGVVHQAPRTHPREIPGTMIVSAGNDSEGDMCKLEGKVVELWPRVMPQGPELREGDVVVVDVMKYRPNAVYFARNVSVTQFCSLGRDIGTILSVKEGGFGFIRCCTREADIYFRVNEVLDIDGQPAAPGDVTEDTAVEFDIVYPVMGEERDRRKRSGSGNDNARARAGRIMLTDANRANEYYVLRSRQHGVLSREPKKDIPGQIRMVNDGEARKDGTFRPSADWRQSENDESAFVFSPEEEFKDASDMLQVFISGPQKEFVMYDLSERHEHAYYVLTEALRLGCESRHGEQVPSPSASNMISTLRIWKFDSDDEYKAWEANKPPTPVLPPTNRRSQDTITFMRHNVMSDTSSTGPLGKDLEVTFDVCINRRTLAKFANDVCVYQGPVAGGSEPKRGTVEVLKNGSTGSVFGYICEWPTRQKILFHSSTMERPEDASLIVQGTLVEYTVTNRGGWRTATCLRVVAETTEERVLEGSCIGVVTSINASGSEVVLVDTSSCEELRNLYASLTVGSEINIDGTTAEPPVRGEPVLRFFPPAVRAPVPVPGASDEFAEGDLVQCNAIVSYGVTWQPVGVCNVQVLQRSACPKVTGTIVRFDLAKGVGEIDIFSTSESKTPDDELGAETARFAFDVRELPVPKKNANTSAQNTRIEAGDPVECIAVTHQDLRMCVCVRLAPKSRAPGPGERRSVVNAVLKTMKKKSGVSKTGVTMAKGPDGTTGFAEGWRGTGAGLELTKGLPWERLVNPQTEEDNNDALEEINDSG